MVRESSPHASAFDLMPVAVPSSEEVTAYLAAHKLEPVIEDAVNDAVLKQVKVSVISGSTRAAQWL